MSLTPEALAAEVSLPTATTRLTCSVAATNGNTALDTGQ